MHRSDRAEYAQICCNSSLYRHSKALISLFVHCKFVDQIFSQRDSLEAPLVFLPSFKLLLEISQALLIEFSLVQIVPRGPPLGLQELAVIWTELTQDLGLMLLYVNEMNAEVVNAPCIELMSVMPLKMNKQYQIWSKQYQQTLTLIKLIKLVHEMHTLWQ